MKNLYLLALLLTLGLTQCVQSQTWEIGTTTLTERNVATGIQVPWEILWGPDDHIWVTERRGKVLRIEPESGNIEELLDLTGPVWSSSEPGMLGMCLHPDFENTPLVYIAYTYGSWPNVGERVSSFEYNGSILENEEILLNGIGANGIHNGSRLLILPDNTMLMSTGDTGDGGASSQNMNSLNGKMLRMNLDGSIPADNPDPSSYVYSWGHRNSQGLCMGNPETGLIYSSEHGQSNADEFNIIEPNRNYGWPTVQGFCNTGSENAYCTANNVKEPLEEWNPCIAVNGIEYYNHPAIPEWQNSVLMAVLGGLGAQYERLTVLHMSEDGLTIDSEDQFFSSFNQRIRDVCVNPHNGAVYLAFNGTGYPSSGPNIIKEFKNEDFVSVNEYVKPQEISVYPNPVDQSTHLSFSDSFVGKAFQIISFSGQVVMETTINATTMDLDCTKYSSGMYYLKATSELGTITKTFMVK